MQPGNWRNSSKKVPKALLFKIFKKYNSVEPEKPNKGGKMDLYATNTITLTGLAPGKYKYKAILKDKLKGKKVVTTTDFEIK
jgi:hypothetical protein